MIKTKTKPFTFAFACTLANSTTLDLTQVKCLQTTRLGNTNILMSFSNVSHLTDNKPVVHEILRKDVIAKMKTPFLQKNIENLHFSYT